MNVAVAVTASVLALGWIFITNTSASLLFPDPHAARDRCVYAVGIASASPLSNLKLRLLILCHTFSTYVIILPLAFYLWIIDEVFFGSYKTIQIRQPLTTISVPRGGTTSFHRTLALDERFVTPSMLELVVPFVCLHKLCTACTR